ncbi:unnamed protein product [Fraxinus pennsylvanica]|uniref:Uncharacterized protein n=1 Tax=Fraxinus pennsylvanica TaxID=56036 RepID=A0AAD1YUC3_9LAMI|nr:unnamed protein product [Fraxinus pennsylvanica]
MEVKVLCGVVKELSGCCKELVEPLTLEELAYCCHCPDDIEMIYKIIAHMAANDRALIAEGSCGSPRNIKVFLGECNVDEIKLSPLAFSGDVDPPNYTLPVAPNLRHTPPNLDFIVQPLIGTASPFCLMPSKCAS